MRNLSTPVTYAKKSAFLLNGKNTDLHMCGVLKPMLSILILAVSLSIDALFAGLAYGLGGTKIPLVSKLTICMFSVIYAGLALVLGSVIKNLLPSFACNIIGASILFILGGYMLLKGLFRHDEKKEAEKMLPKDNTIFKIMLKGLGITIQVLRTPSAVDIDKSGTIDLRESILLGSALSLDALGAGIGSAISGMTGFYVPFVIGVCQLMFLSGGLFAGKRLIKLTINSRAAAILPGLCLIALGVVRL